MVAAENVPPARRRPILSIGGTDPTGGAGLAADVRAGAGVGVHVATVVTCVTVQDERGVRDVHPISGDLVRAQAEAALSVVRPAAVKVGALGSADAAEAVAAFIERARLPVVLDPVLAASSGGALAPAAVRRMLFSSLAERATVVTPNRPELEAWVGEAAPDLARVAELARRVSAASGTAVCVKGGHGPEGDVVVDVLGLPGGRVVRFEHPRRPGGPVRGTGCTFATALAAAVGAGLDLPAAVAEAIAYVDAAWQASVAPDGAAIGDLAHRTGRSARALSVPTLSVPKVVPPATEVVRVLRGG